MHYVLLLSLLAYGLLGLPFGAAAPLPSTSSLSPKERNSKPLHLEREFSSLISIPTPSTTVHSPSVKRGLLFPPSIVTSIATSPITPGHAKKRQDNHPIEASLGMAKRSEDTLRLTERQQKGSATEERSPTMPGEEPRAWSGLDSRSIDIDNVDSILGVRANAPSTPSTPDSAKDPDYNKKNGYWAPWPPLAYAWIGVGSGFAVWLIYEIVGCIAGGKHVVDYLKAWWDGRKKRWQGKAERKKASNAVVAVPPA